jgi:hypothetical protein
LTRTGFESWHRYIGGQVCGKDDSGTERIWTAVYQVDALQLDRREAFECAFSVGCFEKQGTKIREKGCLLNERLKS